MNNYIRPLLYSNKLCTSTSNQSKNRLNETNEKPNEIMVIAFVIDNVR